MANNHLRQDTDDVPLDSPHIWDTILYEPGLVLYILHSPPGSEGFREGANMFYTILRRRKDFQVLVLSIRSIHANQKTQKVKKSIACVRL